ncbi:Ribosomal RNA small subunit methyltransferase G [Desulfotomaculum nigrificans CO-1-SRB]|uniref:Ribosomal RNA small subunit methyltransferase G n=1 Tax=Desulfotomaculum nigrificans (strain DSM 14880 / VKM B-2319 / CO-1-SRB) TaxID=868595 RepID=F6B6S6_DESCC|nr:16S rRNA (guanine(527)-N(7))-methyltransferase RsmG [Desulfotomaculum nigrificans]AEF95557.1 Ribosomal RNA small subunit methyltransferase G [Desulfotomaculum nigrificans CO-1-SRB]
MVDVTPFLNQGLEEIGLPIETQQISLFNKYLSLIIEGNEKINLTAILEPKEVAIKHFVDSLTCLLAVSFPTGAKVLDIGSGAGFPGVPLKIYRPDLQITLMDSLNKRILFLQDTINKLGLNNITAIHSRAEDFGQQPANRENFDVVVSRAVARLVVLSEYCLPCVKIGGYFISQKGPDIDNEIKEAQKAIDKLGGQLSEVKKLQLPLIGDPRSLVVIKKIKPTPKQYPRKAGVPAKKPIV